MWGASAGLRAPPERRRPVANKDPQDVLGVGEEHRGDIARALGTSYHDVKLSAERMPNGRCRLRGHRSPNAERDDERSNPYHFELEAETPEDLATALGLWCATTQQNRAYRTFLTLLPYDARQAQKDHAHRVLNDQYRVYLGSHTESVETFAISLLRQEYQKELDASADLILDMLKNGDLRSSDEYYEAVCTESNIDNDSDAYRILLVSNNDEAWRAEGSEQPEPMVAAAYAYHKDLAQLLERAGVRDTDIAVKDCARCGEVVVWNDTDTCPKCDLEFAVEEKAGFAREDTSVVCEDCRDEDPREDDTPLTPDTSYECGSCGTTYYNPKAPKPT